MNQGSPAPKSPWTDPTLVACVVAIDPSCGVVVRASAGPVRDQWLALVRGLLPQTMPWRRVPLHATDERLLGGLDFAATLAAGRPIAERGLLVEADGGMVVLAMAERMTDSAAARLAAVLDHGAVVMERDGLTLRTPARFGVIALDEGAAGEERRPPSAVLDRAAFHIDLDGIALKDDRDLSFDAGAVAAARALLPHVRHNNEPVDALCAAALALGISSLRAPLLALRAARGLAALAGRSNVVPEDAAAAARLVLAPRAAVLPLAETSPQAVSEAGPPRDPQGPTADDAHREAASAPPLEDIVLTAAQAAIPAALLAQLQLGPAGRLRVSSAGHSGVARSSSQRGRPAGVRNAERLAGARLNLIETLRAAAPWQRLRRCNPDGDAPSGGLKSGVVILRQDFRVIRFKQRTQTTSIFVVDASGSAALHRLAEVKGAVELLLAECYVRRDQVALLAFRGCAAELVLPPTRSLVRAKRSLAGLPGGGATPLAAGIDAAARLADAIRRKGQSPLVILMTDGRANIARNGDPGRARAEADALLSAQQLRTVGAATVLVDTSPQPSPHAARLAAEMGARYLPLPHVDAVGLSHAILRLPAFANRGLLAR